MTFPGQKTIGITKKMTIEVLISTMFKKNNDEIIALLDEMNISSDCVVINQCDEEKIEYIQYRGYIVIAVYSHERGLSKSRNLALMYANADIIVVADDDVCYVKGYSEIIMAAYEANPDADILTFKVKDGKKYFSAKKRLNFLTIHKVASWEITMKLCSVKSIKFNEVFGAGSPYFQCGEENIFLRDCLKNRKHIIFSPDKIGFFPESSRASTWFAGFDKGYMINQGAVYYELSHLLAIPYILQFSLRKYKLYKKYLNVFSAIYYMFSGMIKCMKISRKVI
jgi:glycosyltransferase involved in cell wall biosynthesis